MMTRPSVERYVRCSFEIDGELTVEPGLEHRRGDAWLAPRLREVAETAARTARRELAPVDGWREDDMFTLADHLEYAIGATWPGRAWFAEVHHASGWIQIFQPYGVPRNDNNR